MGPMPRPLGAAAWQPAAMAMAAAALCLLAMFHQTGLTLVRLWASVPATAHGVAILPIALWLAWERRQRLAAGLPRPAPAALLPFAACLAVWTLAQRTAVQVLEQAALIGLLQWLVPVVLGWRAARILAAPLLFLVFALPAGDALTPWLQDLTVAMVAGLRAVAGLTTQIDGRLLITATGTYEVAENCAGLGSLASVMASAFVAADLLFVRMGKSVLFIAVAGLAALVANGVRAFAITVAGDAFGPGAAILADHAAFGWALSSAVLAGLFILGWLARDHAGLPHAAISADGRATGRHAVLLTAAAALALAAAPQPWQSSSPPAPPARPAEAAASGGGWHPTTPGADLRHFGSVTAAGHRIDRLIAVYATQGRGKEAVGSGNDLSGPGWRTIDSGWHRVTVDGRPLTVPIRRLAGREGQRLLVFWFWIDGVPTGNPVAAKLRQAGALLRGGGSAAALVAVSVPLDGPDDLAAATAALDHVLAAQHGLAGSLVMAVDQARPLQHD